VGPAFGGELCGTPPNGETREPGWVGVDEGGGGCMRCAWSCGFILDAFMRKDGAFDVVGIKFGGRFAAVDVGMFPPYGELEYGV
jgi:hypothetical protein